MSDPDNSYSGQSWLGVGPPLVIGVGIFVAGLVLMFVWRTQDKRYWQERAGLPDPDVVHGVKAAADGSRRTGGLTMAVVLGYDESPGADAALAAAIEVASRYGEELVLVYGAAPPGGLGEECSSHRDALMEMGRTATAHALERAEAAGVDGPRRARRRQARRGARPGRRPGRRHRHRRRHRRREPDPGRDAGLDAAQAPAPGQPPGAVRARASLRSKGQWPVRAMSPQRQGGRLVAWTSTPGSS